METIFDFFNGNYLFNAISLLIGFVGVILAIVFYFKALKEKRPTFNIKSFGLIDSKLSTINKLEIRYNNSSINNLSVSKIAIWNAGMEPITKADFAPSDHLRIMSRNSVVIYDYELSYQKEVNNISVTLQRENQVYINFDFLNKNDGLILSIYHSGHSSDDILVTGTFIGAKKISKPTKEPFLIEKISHFSTTVMSPYDKLSKPLKFIFYPITIIFFFLILPFMIMALFFDAIRYRFVQRPPETFSLNNAYE
ncbi:hypothetical protein [Parapedobacter sp. 2B3]|uniref:hypothetical protein n=1 Tax=Parapedobacter sp. 2B3 TaxID=3342381 RepID=UPI0035B67A02